MTFVIHVYTPWFKEHVIRPNELMTEWERNASWMRYWVYNGF